MPNYETLVLVDPVLSDDEVTKFVAELTDLASKEKGKVTKEERLGRRRLAYPIRKKFDGNYVCLQLDMPQAGVKKWERGLRLKDKVLRQMTIRVEP